MQRSHHPKYLIRSLSPASICSNYYFTMQTCQYNKMREDTWLRVTWNGNMRITRCDTCCMRWYITIDGEECVDPGTASLHVLLYLSLILMLQCLHNNTGPIDAVIFQSRNYHLVRQSTISGACRSIGAVGNSTSISTGGKRIQFSIQDCPGFGGFVYDAYTGWNSVSRIRIEEMQPSKSLHVCVCLTVV